MLAVNRQLNSRFERMCPSIHRLEDLINGYNGVCANNFNEVNVLISRIERDVVEMNYRVVQLDYAEKSALLIPWTNGRKYPWDQWLTWATMSINQAKGFVNQYSPGYYV